MGAAGWAPAVGGCLPRSWGADPGRGAPEMGQGVQAPRAGHRSGVSPVCSVQAAGNPVRGMGFYPHYIRPLVWSYSKLASSQLNLITGCELYFDLPVFFTGSIFN